MAFVLGAGFHARRKEESGSQYWGIHGSTKS